MLRRLFRRNTITESDDAIVGEEAGETASDGSPISYDPNELERRADTLDELGLEPVEFVTHPFEGLGGTVRQQAFTEYTDLSEPTILRALSELEEDTIVRIQLAREKLVCLPGEPPTSIGQSQHGTSDTRRSGY